MTLRRRVLQGAAAGGLTLWMSRLLAAGNQPVAPGIRQMSGDVRINGQVATEGRLVMVGDTVSTGANSRVVYVVGQDAYLVRDNSQVQHLAEGTKGVLRVLTGKVLAVFGKGDKRIETTTSTVGIRGTGVYLEVAPDEVYFCLCYGKADVKPLAAPQEVFSLQTYHHEKPMVIGRAPGAAAMRAAEVHNHTDDELFMLEALTGRRPPFVYGGGSRYGSGTGGEGGGSGSGSGGGAAATGPN